MLIWANSKDNYNISKEEVLPNKFPAYIFYVAGWTDKMQDEVGAVLEEKLKHIRSYDEIKNIIRFTIYEIAERYPGKINNHAFIRRLSKEFDL